MDKYWKCEEHNAMGNHEAGCPECRKKSMKTHWKKKFREKFTTTGQIQHDMSGKTRTVRIINPLVNNTSEDIEDFISILLKEQLEEVEIRLLPFVTATGTPLKPIEGGYDKVKSVLEDIKEKV